MDVVEFSSADRRENRLKYVHIRRRRSYFGPSKRRPVHIRNSNRFCQRVFADAFTIISKIVRARVYISWGISRAFYSTFDTLNV